MNMYVPEQRKYTYIQGLRFLSALMVVLCHSTFYIKERLNPGIWFYNLGANGVSLFFVISGFVIMLSGERLIKQGLGWRRFAIKRAERIVPLYWIYTTAKLLIMAFTFHMVLHARWDSSYIVKSYLFIPARNVDGQIEPILGVGWTLIFEMAFYALLTVSLILKKDPLWVAAPVILIFFGLSFLQLGLPLELKFFANPLIIEFLYGLMIAKWVRLADRMPRSLAIVGLAIGLLFLFLPRLGCFDTLSQSSIGFGLAAAVVVVCLVSLERNDKSVSLRWLSFLGAASYSLYLVHPIITPMVPEVMHRLGVTNAWVALCACIVVALSGGVMSYLWLEKPVTRRLSRLTSVPAASFGSE